MMKKIVKTLLPVCAACCALVLGACAQGEKEKAAPESSEGLLIVAHVDIQPEYRAEMLEAFQTLVDATRQEPGNISYDLYEDTANPDRFTFIEMWRSQEAIDAHNASEHFLKFVETSQQKAAITATVMKRRF